MRRCWRDFTSYVFEAKLALRRMWLARRLHGVTLRLSMVVDVRMGGAKLEDARDKLRGEVRVPDVPSFFDT